MGDKSTIEWTDATWNPVTGCTVTSAGCRNCYAMHLAGTRLRNHPSRAGLTRQVNRQHVWTGEVRFNEQWLDQPQRWKTPRLVFVCAHGDLFHEDVPDAWVDRVFEVMEDADRHVYQVLTKRAARLRTYIDRRYGPMPMSRHIWLGVSAEDQVTADGRIPELLETPQAAIRFLSYEPALGPLDLGRVGYGGIDYHALQGWRRLADGTVIADPQRRLHWVIAGGESLPNKARASSAADPNWFRTVRDQCSSAEVPFFFKQWGEYLTHEIDGVATARVRVGKKRAGRLLDGRKHDAMPEVFL
jgi:protein gp37